MDWSSLIVFSRWFRWAIALLAALLVITLQSCLKIVAPVASPVLISPFTAQEVAVIFNEADPLSVRIAQYYQQQRQIPPANMIAVNFATGNTVLSLEEFQRIKTAVDAKTPATVQGYALTWVTPYRVECMSITSAFAFGFNRAFCADSCRLTQDSPYFNSVSSTPYTDFQLRPTMAIAATTFAEAKALIDRGIASDHTSPPGTAYLMSTSDPLRNVRVYSYPRIVQNLGLVFSLQVIQADVLENKPDIMFYFTGLATIKKIKTNHFRPGAIADHLTSYGGMLTDSPQMTILRWLEAGATASYGATVEPCNFPQKFPHPGVVMQHYLAGETLLEAYWKSVAQPGQGIFIGEPLARPFS